MTQQAAPAAYPKIDKDPWKLAANGTLDLLEKVVDDGANVNAKDTQGCSPLVRILSVVRHLRE